MNDDIEPIFVSVVRLRTSGKGSAPPTKHSKRPYLLLLTPDQLQLFTTNDAVLDTGGPDPLPSRLSLSHTFNLRGDPTKSQQQKQKSPPTTTQPLPPLLKRRVFPILGGKKAKLLAKAEFEQEELLLQQQQQNDASVTVASTTTSTRKETTDNNINADELQDDQVFKIGVSLNQIMAVQLSNNGSSNGPMDRLTVSFQPNKPSKRSTFEVQQTLGLLRGFLGYGSSRALVDDPQAHHFTIQLPTAEEAEELKRKIYKAQENLAQAVAWLSEGFPLLHDSTVVMLTISAPTTTTTGATSKRELKRLSTTPSKTPTTIMASCPAYNIPFPRWGAYLELPDAVSDALSLSGSTSSSNSNSSSKRSFQPVVIGVYLTTPLGPAVAEIPVLQLHRSAQQGGSPLTVVAQLQNDKNTTTSGDDDDATDNNNNNNNGEKNTKNIKKKKKEKRLDSMMDGQQLSKSVLLHFRAERGVVLPSASEPDTCVYTRESRTTEKQPQQAGTPPASPGNNASVGIGGSGSGSPLAGGSSPRGSSPVRGGRRPPQILREQDDGGGVVVFAIGLASNLVRRVRRTVGNMATNTTNTATTLIDPTTGLPLSERYRWHLILLSAETVEEQHVPHVPLVQRTLSYTGAPPDLSQLTQLQQQQEQQQQRGVGSSSSSSVFVLPACIEMLVEEHKDVLTNDTAQRFLVGMGNESRAYTAMLNVVTYTRENNLVNILTRPNPAFFIMKQYYQHGTLGWSKKKDCLVEVEATGHWPEAYEKIRSHGFTDTAMLEHLLFIQKYQFKYNDPRPLPHGKTVKIVDLDGLQMSCLRSDAFKLISKVGALLGAQSPQRMHVCFFVNAPSWWSIAWNLISPMIPAKVRKHMKMYGKSQAEAAKVAMLEWIDEELLPVEYGGRNVGGLKESELEKKLAEYVKSLDTTSNSNSVEGIGTTAVGGGGGDCVTIEEEIGASGVVDGTEQGGERVGGDDSMVLTSSSSFVSARSS